MDLQEQARPKPWRASAPSSRTMAILMMSAAEPWNGAFNAMRSAFPRTIPLDAEMSGIGRTRPKMVVTSRVRRASSRIPSR